MLKTIVILPLRKIIKLHLRTNAVSKFWWTKVIPQGTKPLYTEVPVAHGCYAWGGRSIIRAALSHHCSFIDQDGVWPLHTERSIRYPKIQGSVIAAEYDILRKCVDFVDCVSTRHVDESDVGGGVRLLYL